MKKILLTFFFLSSLIFSQAQCSESEEYKVLLIGDSWAFFMGVDGTFDNVFNKWGHTNQKYFTNLSVAVNGARTTDFLETDMQDEITNVMITYPSIDVIHLSIAGNDVLGQWDTGYTQAELDDLIDEVYNQSIEIIDFLKTTRPGVKIVFSGYVYPNFQEVLQTDNPLDENHPFYSRWEGMDFPTFLEINTILNDFSLIIETYAATDPQVEFYKATALMQYTFGQNDVLGVAPGGTYPPFTQPQPFGDPNYPSPKESMRDYLGITRDCFHLSPKGYRDLIGYHTQKFYHHYLMDDQYLLSNLGEDGSTSSMGTSSTALKLGKESGEEFATILNFHTQDMNWEGLDEVEIFLQVEAVQGDNPLNSPLELSIKSGNLGSNEMPEASDWSASVDLTETPCIYSSGTNAGHWIRIKLPETMFPFIQAQTNTQFLLKTTATTDGSVVFTNASDGEFAPVLNLKYDATYTSIKEENKTSQLVLFPNPTANLLRVSNNEEAISTFRIIDVLGKVCREAKLNSSNLIEIGDLNAGYYTIQFQMGNQWVNRSFVKN